MKKNKEAVSLGKSSWARRTEGMTKEEISEMMSKLKKGKKLDRKVINKRNKKKSLHKTNA